nr:TIGR02611 family protein [Allorhizocola rhizosphaerae]
MRTLIRLTYRAIRANPLGDLAVKIFVAVLGGLVVALGLVLIPLPGPGWLIVIGGLAIWAIEFIWARHLLAFTRNKLRGWTNWVKRQSLAVRLLIGAAGLVFVGLVAALTLKYSFGVDLLGDVWNYITTH